MSFALICIIAILGLGIVAALSSIGGKDEPVVQGHDCSSCASMTDGSCKIACLMEEKKRKQGNKEVKESV
jgi:hypothetical protein